jgi:hypothetical protein
VRPSLCNGNYPGRRRGGAGERNNVKNYPIAPPYNQNGKNSGRWVFDDMDGGRGIVKREGIIYSASPLHLDL